MALLKWLKERLADGAPVWEGIYDNAIRNRLRRDKNLADLTDRAEARKNLDLVGEVETHWHDSRYMPHINKLRKDADDLRTDLTNDEKIISNNVKRLDVHDQDIKQLQDRATKVENRATALESRATAVESRATNLEKNVSNLQGKTSTLETEMTGTKGRVTTLEGDVSALKTARTNLESETASLKTRTSGLETRMGQAEKDISNLKSSTDTLKSKTDGLTAKTTNLETRCGIIEGSNSKLETRCSTIEGNANQLAGRVSSLEKKTWIENAGHATTADTATNANAAKSANTADSATKAVNDGDNRNIVNTYATKAELNTQKNRLDGKEFVKNDTASKRISLKYETENGKNVVAPYVDGVKVPLSSDGPVKGTLEFLKSFRIDRFSQSNAYVTIPPRAGQWEPAPQATFLVDALCFYKVRTHWKEHTSGGNAGTNMDYNMTIIRKGQTVTLLDGSDNGINYGTQTFDYFCVPIVGA